MKIAYYMPFKPLGHSNPSGDLVIGTELFDFLVAKGANISSISKFRSRWIYLKPYLWPLLIIEIIRVLFCCLWHRPDIWLTYHSYYKAPDIIGPLCCRLLNIPYVIFQGIYSTKRRRDMKTITGFYLNRAALRQAAMVLTNKKTDQKNLKRLLPADRVFYIPPGVHPEDFCFELPARLEIRRQLQVENRPVVMTAAMFRPGVKTEGIYRVIESCERLRQSGIDIVLLIAGDGVNREKIAKKAADHLGNNAILLGKLPRHMMKRYYSAADIFAFPGIEESLGMVFLEAQACGLPVVAYADWGAKEAVIQGQTGLLSAGNDENLFDSHLEKLIIDATVRKAMGFRAVHHINRQHNLDTNYTRFWQLLQKFDQLHTSS